MLITLLSTLIGAFITSSGILVGADSRVSGGDVTPSIVFDKTCVTSSATVAALQGEYGFVDSLTHLSAPLNSTFRDVCDAWRNNGTAPRSTEAQASQLADRLRAVLSPYVAALGSRFLRPFRKGADPHIVYVMVAGYDGSRPSVSVHEVRVDRVGQGPWVVTTNDSSRLELHVCGSTFTGEDALAVALLRNTQTPLTSVDINRPGAEAARRARGGHCEGFTDRIARTFYRTAVQLTIQKGTAFNIDGGVVGFPIHLITIGPNGLKMDFWEDAAGERLTFKPRE